MRYSKTSEVCRVSELRSKVLEVVTRELGITLEELAERIPAKKYDLYRAVKELVSEGLLVQTEEKDKFDPYRPTWTRSFYLGARAGEYIEEGEVASEEEPESPEGQPNPMFVGLVATHPNPPSTDLDYSSFVECLEMLASESDEVVGVVGYIDLAALRDVLYSLVQRLRKAFGFKLLCTGLNLGSRDATEDELERYSAFLRASGVRLDVKVVRDEFARKLHAKFLISGELVYVGSHNFTDASLQRNLEVGILLRDPSLARGLRKLFEEFWGGREAVSGSN